MRRKSWRSQEWRSQPRAAASDPLAARSLADQLPASPEGPTGIRAAVGIPGARIAGLAEGAFDAVGVGAARRIVAVDGPVALLEVEGAVLGVVLLRIPEGAIVLRVDAHRGVVPPAVEGVLLGAAT